MKKIPVVVFLKMGKVFQRFPSLKKLSIDQILKILYTSKNDAATKFSSEIGENFVEFLGYNPLLNSFDIYFSEKVRIST